VAYVNADLLNDLEELINGVSVEKALFMTNPRLHNLTATSVFLRQFATRVRLAEFIVELIG
jgi:hypothetical protein